MSKLLKTVTAGLLLTVGTAASALESDWYFKPYVGGDVGVQNQDFETGFGDFHFKSSYPVTNLNVGVNLHQYIGIEAGYEHMYQRERVQYYAEDGSRNILGFAPLVPGNPRTYFSKVWSNGFTLSAILKYPIYKDTTEVFATLGANWARNHYETVMIQGAGNESTRPLFWKSDRHAIARIGAGIKHAITPNFGGRVMYVYEGTSKLDSAIFPGTDREGLLLNVPAAPTSSAHLHTVKPKGSHLVMAGLYYQADWV